MPYYPPAAAPSAPGGADTQVQFNDSSAFGGDADLTWNKTSNRMTLNGDILSPARFNVVRLSRAVGGTVNDYTEIGKFVSFGGANQGSSQIISVTVSQTGYTMSKMYAFSSAYPDLAHNTGELFPLTNSGGTVSGANDFALDALVSLSDGSVTYRVRNKSGSSFTAYVTFFDFGPSTFTEMSGTGTGTASGIIVSTLTDFNKYEIVTRSIPTSTGSHVEIGTLTNGANAAIFAEIAVIVNVGGYSVAKNYFVTGQYGGSSSFGIVQPVSSIGDYLGRDFQLEASQATDTMTIRLRTVSGTGGDAQVHIRTLHTFAASSTTTTSTGPTNSYPGSMLSLQKNTASFVGVAAASNVLNIRGAASHSAKLTEWQDNSGTLLSVVDAGGQLGVGLAAPVTPLHVIKTDAVTAAITNVSTYGHNSSGTPAAGFGPGVLFQGESTTTIDMDMARLAALWDVATHASRSAALKILISNSAGEVDAAQFDDDATAGNTRLLLYDVDNGQLERVSVGIADSGGVGFKLLRIAN